MSLFLILALIPAFRIADLPWRFDWHRYLVDFWLALSLESVIIAALVYMILFQAEFVRWINQPPKTAGFQTQIRGAGRLAEPDHGGDDAALRVYKANDRNVDVARIQPELLLSKWS